MARNLDDSKGLFWDSQGGDRKYNASSFERWLSKFFTTGVFAGDCEVTAGESGLSVVMASGYANTNGKVRFFDDSTILTLATADGYNPRIDTVVIERNDNNREITVKIVTGTPSATPVPVAPIRTGSIFQLVIAEIYVDVGATSISEENITRTVTDETRCGVVTGTVANNQIMYGTEDLTPGVSELANGTFYFVYE